MPLKLAPLTLAATLLLCACSSPDIQNDDSAVATATPSVAETAPEAVSTESAVDARPPLPPKDQEVFGKALQAASTVEEVRAIYNNLPDSKLRDEAAEKLDNMILEALSAVKTYDVAEQLHQLSLEGSTSSRMAKMKMDQFPRKAGPSIVDRPSASPAPVVSASSPAGRITAAEEVPAPTKAQ